ncbi:MAG: tRNA (adenosine(37)-N6)-threonylcarbamoyltransferase complex dimerization subunit type 1 TsaB [Verrucomicrobiota bacterium]|nr:tRNA (adenosine(37)-N6)-threonylcarbamoyltransferase complex dimerization subunit type 1 TsaB [Verrucomicrobiota bacterium]
MITLAIETSTPRGSVALSVSGELVFSEHFQADRSHSSALFASLARGRTCAQHVDEVVVGLGPGSYAGVRIGIASALSFELALNALPVGIPSVAALHGGAEEYLAIGDARRETFYFAHVRGGVCLQGPKLVTETQLHALAEEKPLLPLLTSTPLRAFPAAQIAYPSAAILARLAERRLGIVARGDLEPLYLREPHITRPQLHC